MVRPMTAKAKIRLYVEQDLAEGQSIVLDKPAAHYLFGVMRLGVGAQILLFNGRDGEYLAEVTEAGKRGAVLTARAATRPLVMPPNLWLLFAPVKKARTDFIVEKAVEMGVRRLCPVQTQFINSERLRRDRQQAHAVEAAEQCGATYVPEVAEMVRLDRVLEDWPDERVLYYCDESAAGRSSALSGFLAEDGAPAAILIGPEGGFSPQERERLAALPFVRPVALGPRILRADTAAVAALTLWQATQGDWR